MSGGSLSILNVLEGDVEIRWDSEDAAECERARKVVEDLLRRGFLIMIDTPTGSRRVKAFDPTAGEYVLADTAESAHKAQKCPSCGGRKHGRGFEHLAGCATGRARMDRSRVHAVAPIAGG